MSRLKAEKELNTCLDVMYWYAMQIVIYVEKLHELLVATLFAKLHRLIKSGKHS